MNRIALIALVQVIFFSASFSQNGGSEDIGLPFDLKAKKGKLSNGLTYYIRPNDYPKGRVYMYFVVRAGTLHEEEDQYELAHLLEHMAFLGTENFGDVFDYMGKKGLIRGTDINANTTNFSTVYKLIVPSSNDDVVLDGLRIFRDWVDKITLDSLKIDTERGVVISEIERGMQYSKKVDFTKKLVPNTECSARGKVDTRDNVLIFKHSVLKRFYETWYQPNLQSVIVVGDVNARFIESNIRRLFSDAVNKFTPVCKEACSAALTGKNDFIALVDDDFHEIDIRIYNKYPGYKLLSEKDYRLEVITHLYDAAVKRRFDLVQADSANKYKLLSGSIQKSLSDSNLDAVYTVFRPMDNDNLKSALKSALVEVERIGRFGFSLAELDNAKRKVLRSYESNFGYVNSEKLVYKYMGDFTSGEPALNEQYEREMFIRLIRDISVDEFNSVVRSLITCHDIDVVLMAPKEMENLIPEKESVLDLIQSVRDSSITSYNNFSCKDYRGQVLSKSSVAGIGKIRSKKRNAAGVTELRLDNGLKVIMKPLKDPKFLGKVSFSLLAPNVRKSSGGLEYVSDFYTGEILMHCGVLGLSGFEIQQFLNEEGIMISPHLDENFGEINGVSHASDAELMVLLLRSYLVGSEKGLAEFNRWRDMKVNAILDRRNENVDPQALMNRTMNGRGDVSSLLDSIELISGMQYEYVLRRFKDRFCDLGNVTAVVTGDFSIDSFASLIVKYLGTLRSTQCSNVISGTQRAVAFDNRRDSLFYFGDGPRAVVYLNYSGSYVPSETNNLLTDFVVELTRIRLIDRLRLKAGATYSVDIRSQYSKIDTGQYFISINFECDPDRVKELINNVIDEFRSMSKDGILQSEFNKAKAIIESKWSIAESSNAVWHDYLKTQVLIFGDFGTISRRNQLVGEISIERCRRAISILFGEQFLSKFIQFPGLYHPKSDVYSN